MDVSLIARDLDAFQRPVAVEQYQSHIARAHLDAGIAIGSIRELGGGSINNTFAIGLAGMPGVILRVAQAPATRRPSRSRATCCAASCRCSRSSRRSPPCSRAP